MIDTIVGLLMSANLLNSRSSYTLGILGVIILFLFVTSVIKKALKAIVLTGIIFVMFIFVYVAKVNIVDNNNLEFTTAYIESSTQQIAYKDIERVALANGNKEVVVTSSDGSQLHLNVGTNYAKAVKGAIERMADIAGGKD